MAASAAAAANAKAAMTDASVKLNENLKKLAAVAMDINLPKGPNWLSKPSK